MDSLLILLYDNYFQCFGIYKFSSVLDILTICNGWALKTYDDGVAGIKRCKRRVEEISNSSLFVWMKLGDLQMTFSCLSTVEGIICVQCQSNAEKVLSSAQEVGLTLSTCQALCCVNGSVGISRVDLYDKRSVGTSWDGLWCLYTLVPWVTRGIG